MQQPSVLKGILLISASSVAFCVMGALVKYLAHIDSFKTALFRFIIGMAVLGTAALFGRIKLTFTNHRLLFLRGLAGGIAVLIFYTTIPRLGMGIGTVIAYSFPVFASIFGALLLKEKVGPAKGIAILAALAGIYLLGSAKAVGSAESVPLWLPVVAVIGAVLGGLAVVCVKKLHDTDTTYAIFFAQGLIGMWIVIVPANVVPCSIGYVGGALLLCVGLTATVGQLLMTEGYRHLPVTTGSLLTMTVPVLNFIVGIAMFQEGVSVRAVAGAIVVIAACAVVVAISDR